jgi:hypothetical protein
MTTTWGDYFANIWLALQGRKNCSKEELDEVKESFSNNGGSYGILVIIPVLIIALSYSFGAAILSYHYNMYKGNSGAVVWAILAYFFSGLYYPYYAFFVDPLSTMTPAISIPSVPGIGGSSRRRR